MSVIITAGFIAFALGLTYVAVTGYVESYDAIEIDVDTETSPIHIVSNETPLYAHLTATIHTTIPDEPHTEWFLDNGVSRDGLVTGSFDGWVSELIVTDSAVELAVTKNDDGFSFHRAVGGDRSDKTIRVNRDDITSVSHERVRTKTDIPLLTNGQPGLVIRANDITYKLSFYISDDTWRSPDNFTTDWLPRVEEYLSLTVTDSSEEKY